MRFSSIFMFSWGRFIFFYFFWGRIPFFVWGRLSSWVSLRLHTENQLYTLPGSALKVCVVGGCGTQWQYGAVHSGNKVLKVNLVISFGFGQAEQYLVSYLSPLSPARPPPHNIHTNCLPSGPYTLDCWTSTGQHMIYHGILLHGTGVWPVCIFLKIKYLCKEGADLCMGPVYSGMKPEYCSMGQHN